MVFASPANQATGIIGRIFGSVFFAIFGAAGLFFCVLLVRDMYQNARTYTWIKTDCVVLDSKVTDNASRGDSPYVFVMKYQYTWEGKEMTSDAYSLKAVTYSQYDEAKALTQKFKADTRSICYVNPQSPKQAILKRPTLWLGFFLVIPLIFVAIGFGGLYATWRGTKKEVAEVPKPITAKSLKGSNVVAMAFFLLFFGAGSLVAWFLAIHPALKNWQAKSWQVTPCTILSSRVQSHSGEDGSTYSVDILYTYEFQGQAYKSSRYDFVPGSSSGYDGKAKIVSRYPQGLKTTCYVNPSAPYEAILSRGFRSDMLWWGILFPIPFLAVGLGGLIFTFRNRRAKSASSPISAKANPQWGEQVITFPVKQATLINSSRRALKPKSPRWVGLLVFLGFAAFWNGILSVFLREVVQSWARHRPEWFLTIFMIPFVLVGLGLICAVVYQFLALFNPRVRIQLNTAVPQLGERIDVQWELRGQTGRIRKLRVYLEGREEVTYSRGTSTYTDRSVFATYELASVEASGNMDLGQAQVRIPQDTMHTLNSSHNKIIWAIHVHGDIPFWPDVKEEFPVAVAPLPIDKIPSV